MKSEQKLEEMVDIVDRLHDYVPTDTLVHEEVGQKNEVIDDNFFKILLGM